MASLERSSVPTNFDPSDFEDTEGSARRWLAAFRDLEEQNLDNAFCSVVGTTEDPSASSSWWVDALLTDPIPSEHTVWNRQDINLDSFHALEPPDTDTEEGGREDAAATAIAAMISNQLQTSMAYSSPMLEKDAADAWARSFVVSMNSGGVPAQWFTNVKSVTESTFDACFVAVRPDLNIVAYILLDDED